MATKSVLVVEDEGIVARDIQNRLGALGFETSRWVTTGGDAIAEVAKDPPDLVLMDIRLRGEMDGIEAATVIQHEHDVPVVYLTAHADAATLERAMGTEPFGYILKPFQDRELHVAVEIALFKHATEKALREREELLRKSNAELATEKGFLTALFASMPSPVLVVSEGGRVQWVSSTLKGEFNELARSRDSVLPGDLLPCLNAIGNPGGCGSMDVCRECHLRAALDEALAGRQVRRRRAELVVEDRGNRRQAVMLVSAAPLDYGDERMAILILEDITELESLRRLVGGAKGFAGMVGRHPRMQEVYDAIADVADISTPVLISGESGTGKELVARAIHSTGVRQGRAFVAVNCAAIPEGLLESELFGHVKGAFTGATRDKKGRFELADGGTIFLDEVGELPASVQVKLLRVLQEQSFERVGDERTIEVDVRVVSATNRDLRRAVAAGGFREDLFYRLCVMPIHLPPLRERVNDIPALAEHALERAATLAGQPRSALSHDTLAVLMDHDWPGNVRELQNALEYALIKCHGETIEPAHLPPEVAFQTSIPRAAPRRQGKLSADSVERALRAAAGNKAQAARDLGVGRATLYRFLDGLESGGA